MRQSSFTIVVVADGESGADGDDLGALRVFPDVRRRPASLPIGTGNMDIAFRPPDLLAGVLIERSDELLLLVVIDHDDEIA